MNDDEKENHEEDAVQSLLDSYDSEPDRYIKVKKTPWKNDAALKQEQEVAMLERQQIYAPLRVLIKSKILPDRQLMPATFMDRLSYFRAYCNSPSKSLFVCWREDTISSLLYILVFFFVFVALFSTYYGEVFLAVYAREHHLYITKMVPITYGISGMYIITSIFEMNKFVDFILCFLDLSIAGFLLDLPWTKCDFYKGGDTYVTYNNKSYLLACMTLDTFIETYKDVPQVLVVKFAAGTHYNCYVSEETGTCNNVPQVMYLINRSEKMERNQLAIVGYFIIIWMACVACHKRIFKPTIFKVMTIMQMICIMFISMTLIYVVFVTDVPHAPPKVLVDTIDNERLYKLLFDFIQFLIGTLTFAPPILHLFSARCERVRPAKESFCMAVGNVVFIMLRGWVNTYVHTHSDNFMNGYRVELDYTSSYLYPCCYYWLIFFTSLQFGNSYCLLYFFINATLEFLTLAITFASVVEIYVSEFRFVKRWMIITSLSALSFTFYICFHKERVAMVIICKMMVLLLTGCAIFIVYPARRIYDDITFHYGTRPSNVIFVHSLLIPLTHLVLVIGMVFLIRFEIISGYASASRVFIMLVVFMGFPFLGGLFFTVFKIIYLNQKNWSQIFCPAPQWGPSHFIARQLRKEYDSAEFIDSQSPRVLSRYLMRNAESDTYKLDIIYDHTNVEPMISETFSQKKFE